MQIFQPLHTETRMLADRKERRFRAFYCFLRPGGAVDADLFRSCFGQFGNAKHLVATAREPSLMGRLAERVSGETQEGALLK